MSRVYNFSAGPAVLPVEVLKEAAEEIRADFLPKNRASLFRGGLFFFISLGTRVALAYILSAIPEIGVVGIWWAIPIGWTLADAVGFGYYFINRKNMTDNLS